MFSPRTFYLATTFFLISFSLYAQKEDYQWAMAAADCPTCYYRFFYDFNTDPPSIVLRSDSLNTTYFVASIASPEGSPLANSNGLRILNAAEKTIENSEGLNPNFSSYPYTGYPIPKTGFFLQKPGNSSIFYLIHLDYAKNSIPGSFYIGKDLRLTTVDLSLNNGLGKVVSKNEVLITGRFTVPTAVRHANGRDWWVLLSDADKNQHFRFLLTPNGFSGPLDPANRDQAQPGWSGQFVGFDVLAFWPLLYRLQRFYRFWYFRF